MSLQARLGFVALKLSQHPVEKCKKAVVMMMAKMSKELHLFPVNPT
jgi:hypothetical protein